MNQANQAEIDLEWNDDHVMPEVINPDVAFLFRKMIEITYQKIDPRPGEIILDVGCGKATDGVDLTRKGARLVGLEPSNIMVACSKENIAATGADMSVVHGIGEHLPFKPGSFDKVYCKGSLDHFPDPSAAIGQMGTMVKPDGEVIIAIANFESLGFKLGKSICWLKWKLGFGKVEGKMVWDTPADHTYRFHYSNLKEMAKKHLEIKQIRGVSLLFGLPWWGSFLSKCPNIISNAILNTLDAVARYLPSISDVIVIRCQPKKAAS
ncbi:MAG: methyltransferase domain-containing protein [Dehalococcoidia bacterium]